jgi:AcrR family transcriptional regulator
MVLFMAQTRALATRQTIIDSAVDLFAERGYGDTTLADITKKAKVTTGAFYHHFTSKKAVAEAIIGDGWPRALHVIDKNLNSASPGLENVIAMTFDLSALMKRDPTVGVANHLNQAFGEFDRDGREGFRRRASSFVTRVAGAVNRADLRDDISPEEVGSLVWINVHGCHLLSDALGDSVFERLELSWRTMLDSVAPEDARLYFEQFVKRTAAQYG